MKDTIAKFLTGEYEYYYSMSILDNFTRVASPTAVAEFAGYGSRVFVLPGLLSRVLSPNDAFTALIILDEYFNLSYLGKLLFERYQGEFLRTEYQLRNEVYLTRDY